MSTYKSESEVHFHINWLLSLTHFVLRILSLISHTMESIVFLMVDWYDVYMYSPLQIYLSPYMGCIPRFIKIGDKSITVFNANIVTYSRTLLIVPVAWSLKYNYTVFACSLILYHDFLDHVDGIVAKVQKKVYGENIDDPLLGGFLDAFCDKIVNVVCLWTILQETNFDQTSFLITFSFIILCYTIITLETIIGIVRVQDYFSAVFTKNKISSQGSTSASMEGKLKETLESWGLAFLCLSTNHPTPFYCWPGIAGIICFALTIRLAYASLAQKLQARNLKEKKKIDLEQEFLQSSSSVQKLNEFNSLIDIKPRERATTIH